MALQLAAAGAGQSSIANQLRSRGFKIDPGSSSVLKATVTRGKSETREYRDAGSATGSQKATFSLEYFQLELIQGGETVWYIQGGSSSQELGDLVILYDGETVQSKANEGRISAGQFFSALKLPELFVKVPENGFYGFSRGTADGLDQP